MKTWFVSRHPGAIEWLSEQNFQVDEIVPHLDVARITAGDRVIGSLPVNLAAKVCEQRAEYWHLSLELPATFRGKELTSEQMHIFGARVERYLLIPWE